MKLFNIYNIASEEFHQVYEETRTLVAVKKRVKKKKKKSETGDTTLNGQSRELLLPIGASAASVLMSHLFSLAQKGTSGS